MATVVKDSKDCLVRVESLDGTKVCPTCKVDKEKKEFGLRTMQRKDGLVKVLQSRCSACRRTAKKEDQP